MFANIHRLFLMLGLLGLFALAEEQNLRKFVPSTISEGWQEVFAAFPDPHSAAPMPKADDVEAWAKIHDVMEKMTLKANTQKLKKFDVEVVQRELAGVKVYEVTPSQLIDDKKIILYTHGGAYTMLSAKSTLYGVALVAEASGLKVVSVDYTNPPKAKWRKVLSEVTGVYEALLKEGYHNNEIIFWGDSAGGALATGAILKLKDMHKPLPAGVVLWSPWADITETGDTYMTLKDAEPRFIYQRVLKPSADAYAKPSEQKEPYVSPVYGTYNANFPPVLIQGGTREIFLSNFVRLYQVMDQAGVEVKLDLYEGMPHVFQTTLADSKESKSAIAKMVAFIHQHLRVQKR